MPPIYPDVNGNRTAYCSIELGINGNITKGVKSINYKEMLEIPKMRGTSAKPQGRGRGTVDFEGDIEFYQADWNALLFLLSRGGTIGFSELGHLISVTHAEAISPGDTVVDRLVSARLHSPEVALSEGGDLTTVKVTLSIMDIIWSNKFKGLRTL
jgi:hypothetical protein